MAKRKKLLKMELMNNINKAPATSDKILRTMEEVFETVVKHEHVVVEATPEHVAIEATPEHVAIEATPEHVAEHVAEKVVKKPKTSTRRRTSRTKKTTGV